MSGKYLAPHSMDCPALAQIVAMEDSGICSQCGATKIVELFFDDQFNMDGRREECPNGCSFSVQVGGLS